MNISMTYLTQFFYNHLVIVERNSNLASLRSKCRHLNSLIYCFLSFPTSVEVNIVFFLVRSLNWTMIPLIITYFNLTMIKNALIH